VQLGLLVLKATQARQAHKDPPAQLVLLVRREQKVILVLLEPQVLLDRQVLQVLQDHLALFKIWGMFLANIIQQQAWLPITSQ
jgi:hypothetical protein